MNDGDNPQLSLGNIIASLPAVRAAKKVNTMSRVHRRLIEPLELAEDEPRLSFQHTVFCQTALPYRNPGDGLRLWQRQQGSVTLEVQTGRVLTPARDFVDVGLPWGTKPRLILAQLNAEAIRRQSPIIEVQNSLSAFVKRIRGFQHGWKIRMFKDQLSRLISAIPAKVWRLGQQDLPPSSCKKRPAAPRGFMDNRKRTLGFPCIAGQSGKGWL